MNFFDYKDGKDFLKKTKFTHDQALDFLDKEILIRNSKKEMAKGG